jgi:DnaK suppressor protein
MNKDMLSNFKTLFEGMLEVSSSLNLEEFGEETQSEFLAAKLQGRQAFYTRHVYEALKRIEKGTFGECVECSSDIGIERLTARPTAKHCIHCQEEKERIEQHIPYNIRSKTKGQEIVSDIGRAQSWQIEEDTQKLRFLA